MLHKARMKDFDKIWSEFKKNRDIFPHIRSDYVKRQIKKNNVIFQDGVVLIYNKYKRSGRLGTTEYKKDDVIIHQILNCEMGNGNATKVMQLFIIFKLGLQRNCRLTVRSSNSRARSFYERQEMKIMGDISWKDNTIEGKIYEINV